MFSSNLWQKVGITIKSLLTFDPVALRAIHLCYLPDIVSSEQAALFTHEARVTSRRAQKISFAFQIRIAAPDGCVAAAMQAALAAP